MLTNYKTRAQYRWVLRYEGVFTDIKGVKYTVHILHKGEITEDWTPPKEMRFGATPLVISREGERMAGLVSSEARLTLLSREDGEYQHLHRKKEGAVMLAVWRGEDLYWLGALDPEEYEEDYTRKKNYFVELRFSDFGHARRLRHKFKGNKSLKEWLALAVKKSFSSGLRHQHLPLSFLEQDLIQEHSSLRVEFPGGEEDYFAGDYERVLDSYASAQAFYEEANESITLYDMIDGILSSLGLRGEMRGDKFVVYDMQYLLSLPAKEINVRSADGVFSADEHYNALNIEIKTKSNLSEAHLEIPKVEGEDVLERDYPRYDDPERIAYSLRAKPIEGASGCYYVESVPRSLGTKEEFIAMCLMPTEEKFVVVNGRWEKNQGTDFVLNRGRVAGVNYESSPLDDAMLGTACHVEYDLASRDFKNLLIGDVDRNPHTNAQRDALYTYKANACFGYEKWLEIPSFNAANNLCTPHLADSRLIATLHLPIVQSGLSLNLSASFFMSFDPSLYQKLEDNLSAYGQIIARRGAHYYHEEHHWKHQETTLQLDAAYREGKVSKPFNPLNGLRAVGIYADMTLRKGDKVYKLVANWEKLRDTYKGVEVYRSYAKRQTLRWVEMKGAEANIPHKFLIPFGTKEFRFGSWVKAEREYVDLGHGKEQIKNELYEKYQPYDSDKNDGMYIPAVPAVGEITLRIYGTLSLGEGVRHAEEYASDRVGRDRHIRGDNNNREWVYKKYEYLAKDDGGQIHKKTSRGIFAMEHNRLFPSYALLKDVKLSVVDSKGKERTKDIKRTATISPEAYEVRDVEPLLSSDALLPDNSPILLRSPSGERLSRLGRPSAEGETNYHSGRISHSEYATSLASYQDTSEVLASEYFAHYGQRRHVIEGAFSSVYELSLLSYVDKTYFATSEEQDLIKARSEMRLSEISQVLFTPKLREGETEEKDNEYYITK